MDDFPSNTENSPEIEFGSELDLHAFSPADTKYLVEYFIRTSHEKGLQTVRIVHGKGKSAKKREVRLLLSANPLVESFSDDAWNWGATIATLASVPGKIDREL